MDIPTNTNKGGIIIDILFLTLDLIFSIQNPILFKPRKVNLKRILSASRNVLGKLYLDPKEIRIWGRDDPFVCFVIETCLDTW